MTAARIASASSRSGWPAITCTSGCRAGSADVAAAAGGLQDLPPGSAGVGLAARVHDAAPEDLDALVVVYTRRGAACAVAQRDLAVFTTALAPPDEAAARAILGSAAAHAARGRLRAGGARPRQRRGAGRARGRPARPRRVPPGAARAAAARAAVVVQGLRQPPRHPLLWRATGIKGVLAVAGREGRTTRFGAPPPAPPVDDARAELVRRFLHAYGPAEHRPRSPTGRGSPRPTPARCSSTPPASSRRSRAG